MREAEGQHRVRLQAEERSIGMVVDRTTGPVRQIRGIPDVVPMAMGKKKRVRFELLLFEKIEEAFRGVDGEAVAAEVDKVGVGGSEATAEGQGVRHPSPFLRPFVCVDDGVSDNQAQGSGRSGRVGEEGERR